MKIKPFESIGGFTTFDNSILDYIMPLCTPNEWKIVCATVRKTKGWHKEEDQISISQYMKLTGIANRTTASKAIQGALNKGFIKRKPKRQDFIYWLNTKCEIEFDASTETVLVKNLDGTETVTELVQKPYTQKKGRNIKQPYLKKGYTGGKYGDHIES